MLSSFICATPPGFGNTENLLNSDTSISRVGRIAAQSYIIQVIDQFPECFIQVRNAVTKDLIDSCLLVLNKQDTIPGIQGKFDLTGLVYNTCSIEALKDGYLGFDTTLVVLGDTSYVINLVPMIIEGVAETANHEIKIYPNPTQGLITVQTREQGVYTMEIISLNGQVLKKMDIPVSSVQVNLSSLQSCIYLIRIIFKFEVYMGRIIKY